MVVFTSVVNCCLIEIFEIFETTYPIFDTRLKTVVNCCLIEIFEIFETTTQNASSKISCCELLFN